MFHFICTLGIFICGINWRSSFLNNWETISLSFMFVCNRYWKHVLQKKRKQERNKWNLCNIIIVFILFLPLWYLYAGASKVFRSLIIRKVYPFLYVRMKSLQNIYCSNNGEDIGVSFDLENPEKTRQHNRFHVIYSLGIFIGGII